jgi:hypothetical protein
MTTPDSSLDPSDIAELAEIMQFLDAWLASDHEYLDQSLTHFVGHNAYNVNRLREDLNRFAALLDPSCLSEQQPTTGTFNAPF